MLIALLSLALAVGLAPVSLAQTASPPPRPPAAKQLAAVRGEVVKISAASRGLLLITVRPARDYAEVTVLARENDLVGTGVGREGGADLLGLLTDDSHDDETITAAELNTGDVVSVIYDPQAQNRVLEIYIH
jgi:DNA-directed RNA polymerase subunit H (RpoH/RPB5)